MHTLNLGLFQREAAMLEIYRSCPKCKAHVQADQHRCKCGQELGDALGQPEVSRTRQVLDYLVFGFALAVIAAGLVRPDWYRAVAGGRVLEAAVSLRQERPLWNGSGAEPKARAWAWVLEKNLASGCSQTYLQLADKKKVSGMLNFQLVGGTLEASKQAQAEAKARHEKIQWMTQEEVADGAASMGRYEDFLSQCLERGYGLIEPCEKYKNELGSTPAATCLVPPVERMLSGLAWRICADHATLPRVKTLCHAAAERMEATPRPIASGGM
jgi:hypothetical protein